jgi:hypothetical protein
MISIQLILAKCWIYVLRVGEKKEEMCWENLSYKIKWGLRKLEMHLHIYVLIMKDIDLTYKYRNVL